MSLPLATQITAVATAVLAAYAIVTAAFAILAFRKQSAEVTTLQQQAEDQRNVNEKQTTVLELQARELQASLDQRAGEYADLLRSQASRVFTWNERATSQAIGSEEAEVVTAYVKNTSEQPVYDVRFSWGAGVSRTHLSIRQAAHAR